MSHVLRFYTLTAASLTQAPTEPENIGNFVHAVGDPLGEIIFEPGEATLFVTAIEDMVKADVFPLLEGSIGETEASDLYTFGHASAEEVESLLSALQQFLDETPPTSKSLQTECERFDLSGKRFLDLLNSFREVLVAAQKQAGEVATLYNTR